MVCRTGCASSNISNVNMKRQINVTCKAICNTKSVYDSGAFDVILHLSHYSRRLKPSRFFPLFTVYTLIMVQPGRNKQYEYILEVFARCIV
jgi:hypothetical protein